MKTLSQLTQSHLSILVLDQTTHNPIARMPVYAEISVVEEISPDSMSREEIGPIVNNSDFFNNNGNVGRIVRLSLAQYGFRDFEEGQKQDFLKVFVEILKGEDLFSKNEDEIKRIVDDVIVKLMDQLQIKRSQTSNKKSIRSYPLGYLATDHVGYVSFDLTRMPNQERPQIRRENPQISYAFFVYPMGKDGTRFDALEQGRFTDEAIFAKLSIEKPTLTRDLKILNLPSMQKPGLVDWYFSPGSFAAHPEFLVGDDGCERLFPAQIALQEFNLRQVVRIVGEPPIQLPEGYKLAYVDDYKVTWQSLGHSLGEILYSLPLAPGESVKLAIIDWSWESTTTRTEKTSLTEDVLHKTHRDRTISETVKAGLKEFQHGSSFMGGFAQSVGGTGTIGPLSVASGMAGSLGGSSATSEGSRELVGENVQRLSDSFSQASSAQREINSTVVVQARQEEKESIQTRTFTNYNHSHTLTILYYEVLRHFKVVVEWVRRRPAVLIKYENIEFNDDSILKYRYLLEDALIDPSLKGGFNILNKLIQIQKFYDVNNINPGVIPVKPFSDGDIDFSLFEFGVKTAEGLKDKTDELVMLNAIVLNGSNVDRPLLKPYMKGEQPTDNNINLGYRFNDSAMAWFIAKPDSPIKWRNLIGFEFVLHDSDEWRMDRLAINAFHSNGSLALLENVDVDYLFLANGSSNTVTFIRRPAPDLPTPDRVKIPEQTLSAEDYLLLGKLRLHLKDFSGHYNGLIKINRNPHDIAVDFQQKNWVGSDKLIDHAEPYPLEVFGSYIAYPFVDINRQLPELNIGGLKNHAEKLITLPTRGVFAEGKLGHCNISEEIDNTRFWKWEEHLIPFEAPGINPVTPITPQPQQTNVTPTAFPASLVNIVNPSAAPDPTGLAAALTVLGTPNIFRDMSGQKEVADLLKKLSDNTIGIAEAANKAREIQAKSVSSKGTDAASSATSTGTSRQGTSGGSGQFPAPSEQHDQLQVLRNAANNGDITTEQKNQMAQDYLQESTQPKRMLASEIGEEAGTVPASNMFREFYIKYLNQQYPNKNPFEDSPYTKTRDRYTLRSYEKAFGKKDDSWNPELGFKPNESTIRKLYDYYQSTYMAKSDKFLWAGLGRMAGGAVLSGLRTPGLPDPSFLSNMMVLIGKAIFLDLAWQHELFLDDPQKTIEMAREHDTRFPARVKYEIAWKKISSNTISEVAEGNRMLLENEQFTIIQPFYDRIKQDSELFMPFLFSKTSAFTMNIHPYHLPFVDSFPTTRNADVTVATDRWEWVTKQDGMWDKWIKIPVDERARLVNLSMDDLMRKQWGSVKAEFLPPGR
jgi:hypothetical protein